ncbi:elongation factor P 5-aminopentanone reductase [Alicyclobacillus sp. SO9]|uniref:elongation factor P 5-aminopentanone reductase n=1 Tax=Alicyclobacillus sp. SO9 TaxID=2665646 RepID=UPI0018E6E557|nr:3-oxoacyl-ACP reductase family protein [Alicyclobacillus sp. SO9]QQE80695.1 3-oxoacyl-ACP reductase FabG [Alicyclobacillus sp. SO9]
MERSSENTRDTRENDSIKLERPLLGKTAIITGASRGIGAAIAVAMANAGARVVVNHRNSSLQAEQVRGECERLGTDAITVQADITDKRQVLRLMEAATELGLPSILVNNAGTALYRMLEDTTLEDYERVIGSNLTGTFLCTKAVLPYLQRRDGGRIINISSVWGISGAAGESVYSAAKGAVIAFTKAMAKELGSTGVTVNTIAPGAVDTDMLQGLTTEDREIVQNEIPLQRFGTPTEVAEAAVFLASPKAAYITGTVLRVDGGFSS